MADSYISNPTTDPGVQLQNLYEALEAGNIKQALRLKTSFMKHFSDSYPREIRDKFHLLTEQLRELEDWQHFATNPKREELCKKKESLQRHNEIHPEEKAKAIKELQEMWRQLGPSDSSEGQRLWQRFKRAGDTAFSVCADYFTGKREHRDKNLQERIKICDSLDLYYLRNDWQNTDWKAASQIVKKAKSEWKRFDDVPHRQRKVIHDRFNQVMLPIQIKLKEEEERNHQLKRDLVNEVESLFETNNNISSLVPLVKQIQSSWKKIGITDRGTDQKLWKEFRKICDDVFKKRDEAKCDRELQKAEEAQKAKQRKTLKESAKRNKQDVLTELKRKAELCDLLEKGAAEKSIATQWVGVLDLPQKLAEVINIRFEQAQRGDIQYAKATQIEEICVKMEMLAHISSPESSQGIRMKLQVERLDKQLSKGIKEDRTVVEQLAELQEHWYCMGPIQHGEKEFKMRFDKAESVIKNAFSSTKIREA